MQHTLPFDPTYGYTLESLQRLAPPPSPLDFDAFWTATYEEAGAVPLRLSRRPVDSPWPELEVHEIEYDSLGGVRIGAWLTLPRGRRINRGVVVGHGYGGRAAPTADVSGPAAAIFPCARGLSRSKHGTIPDSASAHVLHGIESRWTYVHRGCVADYWTALRALLEVVPAACGCLDYMGMSFGGGIGAMLAPWEKRLRRAFLDVPSFGNNPVRLGLPGTGSGAALWKYVQDHPEAVEVLRYFDSAIAATRIKIPVLVAAALFDPAVPPPAQYSVYNALGGPRKLFVRQAAHCDFPGQACENQRLTAELQQWFMPNGA